MQNATVVTNFDFAKKKIEKLKKTRILEKHGSHGSATDQPRISHGFSKTSKTLENVVFGVSHGSATDQPRIS